MTTMTTPGGRFRAFRTQLGLSGQGLADHLGVTKTAVSYWESGRVSLSRTACLLAENLYRVSAAWLLKSEGPMWLPALPPSLPMAPNLVLRPLLPEAEMFGEDGSVIPPRENSLCLGLPRPLVESALAGCAGGTFEDLFFVEVRGREMEPTLYCGDWALVNTGLPVRESIIDHGLYLIQLDTKGNPLARRIAVEPRSGDVLIGIDAPGQVPFRVSVPMGGLSTMVLGKICWIGGAR